MIINSSNGITFNCETVATSSAALTGVPASPGYGFQSRSGDGLYSDGEGTVGLAVGGASGLALVGACTVYLDTLYVQTGIIVDQNVSADTIEGTSYVYSPNALYIGADDSDYTRRYYPMSACTSGTTLTPMVLQHGLHGYPLLCNVGLFLVEAKVVGNVVSTGIVSVAIVSGGTGYTTGDVLALDPVDNGTGFLCTVDPVNEAAGSAVSGVTVTACGQGYGVYGSYLNNWAVSGGTGTGCQFNATNILDPYKGGAYEVKAVYSLDSHSTVTERYLGTTALYEVDDCWNASMSAVAIAPGETDETFTVTVSGKPNVEIIWDTVIEVTFARGKY